MTTAETILLSEEELSAELTEAGWYVGESRDREKYVLCPICLEFIMNYWYEDHKEYIINKMNKERE